MGPSNINPNSNGPIQNRSNMNAQSVTLTVNGQQVVVTYSRLQKIVRGLSKMAYLNGETNDEESYGDEIAEDIFEALKLIKRKKQKK
tara:strand:+ start:1358 stop:1618 length:261 start_codon:yes stop_codon:yes gene_type:complete